jgi:Protein of unknown function (DUF4233)
VSLSSGNPMRGVLAALLIFEVIVFALAAVGMVAVSGMQLAAASVVGGGSCLVALAAASTMRGRAGFPLGWLTQVVAVGLGLATPMMFLMGGIFVALWVVAFVLGKRLDAPG